MINLFGDDESFEPSRTALADGACLLRGFALPFESLLITGLGEIEVRAPFRHMVTAGGFTMSVAMTNCGAAGWFSDRRGYRYTPTDPTTALPWPSMPDAFSKLATDAANEAGFPDFYPDVCLINRYEPGAKMSLHQDKDEKDANSPIVSVSLGLPATFLFGGMSRSDPTRKIVVEHGDVVVWGGSSRLAFHGISPLKEGDHPLMGRRRINLTFRRAL